MSDEQRPLESAQELFQPFEHLFHRIRAAPLRDLRLAMPGKVDRNYVTPLCEAPEDRIPQGGRAARPMQQDCIRRAGRTCSHPVCAQASDASSMVLHVDSDGAVQVVARGADRHAPTSRRCIASADAANPATTTNNMIVSPV